MAVVLADWMRALEALAPPHLAEPWDSVGLVLANARPSRPLNTIVCCIDLTEAVLEEVRSLGAEALVCYHPPLFQPIKKLTEVPLLLALNRLDVAVYSPHTAWDAALGRRQRRFGRVFGFARLQAACGRTTS